MDGTDRLESPADPSGPGADPRAGDAPSPFDRSLRRRALVAATAGTVVEFYDYQIFAVMTVVLAPIFFPSETPGAAVLSTLAVFAVPFVARPFGAALFGSIGDRVGRRYGLLVTVLLMGLATGLIGVLPSHASAGVWAPVLLVLLRLLQSTSAGGETGGATTYLVETAPGNRRGFFGGVLGIGGIAGLGFATAVVVLLNALFTTAQIAAWAWRLPFLLAIVLAGLSLYIRLALEDSPVFEDLKARDLTAESPVWTVLSTQIGTVGRVVGVAAVQTICGYLTTVFAITYLSVNLGYGSGYAASLSTIALVVGVFVAPLAGAVSDRIGRKPFIAGAHVSYLVLTLPLLLVLQHVKDNFGLALLAVIVMTLPSYVLSGTAWTFYAEVFPAATRYSGMSLGFNIAVMLGGVSPFVATLLVRLTGSPLTPGYIVIVIGLIGLLTLRTLPETGRTVLRA